MSTSCMIEYEPDEFTFTAGAHAPVAQVVAELGRAGQYLPFDPMFVAEGATLGGMIATGMSGPGRLRYGGIRDFIIGIKFMDGAGRLVHAGGKVVKNAAGFDFPKLMVGSLGLLGRITEATFKVFPRPQAWLTIASSAPDLSQAVRLASRVASGPFEADAVEVVGQGRVVVRLAGHEAALQSRLDTMRRALGVSFDLMENADDFWRSCLSWRRGLAGSLRIKAALTPADVPALDAVLQSAGAARRYSVACNAAFIEWPSRLGLAELDRQLRSLRLPGICLDEGPGFLGMHSGAEFLQRVKSVLDPQNQFSPPA